MTAELSPEQLEAYNDWRESIDCHECDQPNGGRNPRHSDGKTVWLCSTCDRITPTQ